MARSTSQVIALLTLAAASACLLAGCSSSVEGQESPAVARWVCSWDPTMNHDWHDDYLCRNGTSSERPHLIVGDGYVSSEEVDAAAAAYEAQLNSTS